jgi:succinyl-diaminopimelate desuccinylase
MKGACAVMLELVLARAPYAALFFPREELPSTESALTPLLERERLDHDFVIVMEPTDNELHAGCVGNINATWEFRGRSGHSARPWHADNAITKAAVGIAALAAAPILPVTFEGLTFYEVASVTKVAGGIATNVIPETCTAHVNFRYAPGRTMAEAEERLHELTSSLGALTVTGNSPSGAVAVDHPQARKLIAAGGLHVAPKQAWTPVAEFSVAGYPAVNFGPGQTAQAHQRGESIEIASLLRSYQVLEAFGT